MGQDYDFARDLFGMFGSTVTPQQLDDAWKKFCTTGNPSSYNNLMQQLKLSGKTAVRDNSGKHAIR